MPGMCARCRSEHVDATHIRWTCDNERCGNYAGGIDLPFRTQTMLPADTRLVTAMNEIARLTAERDAAVAAWEDAAAVLKIPDWHNDGGPGDLAEAIQDYRHNAQVLLDDVRADRDRALALLRWARPRIWIGPIDEQVADREASVKLAEIDALLAKERP